MVIEGSQDPVQLATVSDVHELRLRVEPLEGGVLIVGVETAVGDFLILEELDQVHGDEAFTDASFAVDNKDEVFHESVGSASGM